MRDVLYIPVRACEARNDRNKCVWVLKYIPDLLCILYIQYGTCYIGPICKFVCGEGFHF